MQPDSSFFLLFSPASLFFVFITHFIFSSSCCYLAACITSLSSVPLFVSPSFLFSRLFFFFCAHLFYKIEGDSKKLCNLLFNIVILSTNIIMFSTKMQRQRWKETSFYRSFGSVPTNFPSRERKC